MPIRTTSLNAYDALRESGRINTTTALIIGSLSKCPKRGATRRELEERTGLRTNQITGRVRELMDQGIIVEDGKRRCRITGNIVNVLKIAEEG